MLGILLYLDTLSFVSYFFAFVVALYALITRKNSLLDTVNRNKGFLKGFAIFLFLCTLNCLLHGMHGIPNMYMQVFTLIVAFSLKRQDASFFILLTCLECLVGLYEYHSGITSIVQADADYLAEDELMYFRRVNGLSASSSSLSEKLMLSTIMLLEIKPFGKKLALAVGAFLALGFFITFNRTAIIATFIYVVIILVKANKGFINKHHVLGFLLSSAFLVGCIIAWGKIGFFISEQFTRGDTSTMLTGRPVIWQAFGKFISDNFLFGNGSIHLLVPYYSGPIHAHNSFIQLLADHGIFLALLYLLNILLRINKDKFIICLPFFIISLTQYILFWGFTVSDAIFFALLFNPHFSVSKETTKYRHLFKRQTIAAIK